MTGSSRTVVVCLAALLALAGTACNRTTTGTPAADPGQTSSPANTIDPCRTATTPSHGDDRNDAIRRARTVAVATRSPDAFAALASSLTMRARATGGAEDIWRAEQGTRCLESHSAGDPRALLLEGHLLHQRHRFAEAESVARRLVGARGEALDFGLLGDALMEQGKLDAAIDAYQRMADLRPFYQSYVRASHVRWLTGNRDGATALLRKAIGSASPRDPGALAWAHARLSYFELQAGNLDAALAAARTATTFGADDPVALLAVGRALLARREFEAAVDPLQRAAAARPEPEIQWALSDALRAAGDTAGAAAVDRAIEQEGEWRDPRSFALWLASRGERTSDAVALVRRELETRADVFTLDALAWALAADGQTGEAWSYVERALAAGTEDARLFLHAASIADRLGKRAERRRYRDAARSLAATLFPSERAALDAVDSPEPTPAGRVRTTHARPRVVAER